MTLWLKIDGIEKKDDQLIYARVSDNLAIPAERPEIYIDIGHSRFKGKLLDDDDKLIIVADEKLERAFDYHDGFNKGYDMGYKNGIKDSKRKFYKDKTFKKIHDEGYAEGVEDTQRNICESLGLYDKESESE